MANQEHIKILKQGVGFWNEWRKYNPEILPDLSGEVLKYGELSEINFINTNLMGADLELVDFHKADLGGADLRGANLKNAYLFEAYLDGASLYKANLIAADLTKANLSETDLRLANLGGAKLIGANLTKADLTQADLTIADIKYACLVETNLTGTILTGCTIYGISAWGLIIKDTKQENLIITPPEEPTITVDNLEVAQFIYLLLHNEKIRHIIDTITSKVVLILGRFEPPERKAVLDAIREELRRKDYTPVLFDFSKSSNRDITETVSTLAHMAKFVIADITDARTVAAELEHIVPILTSVPVQPLLQQGADEYAWTEHIKSYHWFLKTHVYIDLNDLLKSLDEKIIQPAEQKLLELRK